MRNIIVTLLLPLVLTTTMLQGCGFVDIDTPGQIDGKKMYADEQGFEDVLTGIYATLAKPNLTAANCRSDLLTRLRSCITTTTRQHSLR